MGKTAQPSPAKLAGGAKLREETMTDDERQRLRDAAQLLDLVPCYTDEKIAQMAEVHPRNVAEIRERLSQESKS